MDLLYMVRMYRSSFSGKEATPSKIPSTYPLIAVMGVFRSWEILLIKPLFSLSYSDLLLCILLQPQAHLLEILAQLPDLIISVHIQSEIKIAVPYLLGGLLKLV